MKFIHTLGVLSGIGFLFVSCARAPIKSAEKALRPVALSADDIAIEDDLELQQFDQALQHTIATLTSPRWCEKQMRFGSKQVDTLKYAAALKALKGSEEMSHLQEQLRQHFEPYEPYGRQQWGEVFITSYFEPVIRASRRPRPGQRQPLYAIPKDLVSVRLDQFAKEFPQYRSWLGIVTEQKSRSSVLRGRLTESDTRVPEVMPYWRRHEIDVKNAVNHKATVLGYVNLIDAFFLQIQGSGQLVFPDGKKIYVTYGAQNGHPYVAIGKYLFDEIPREQMSLHTIEQHLETLPYTELQHLLDLNPSYVFFREAKGRGETYFGAEVVDGRTIATDHELFPKGALALLSFEKPIFESEESVTPKEWRPVSRLVVDHDTGGAIRGGGRVDLFWGKGKSAKQAAGVMKQTGRLLYFVPKERFLKDLNPLSCSKK